MDESTGSVDYSVGMSAMIDAMKKALIAYERNAFTGYSTLNSISGSLEIASERICQLISLNQTQTYQTTLSIMSKMIERLAVLCIEATGSEKKVALDEKMIESLHEALPFVPEEEQKEFREIIDSGKDSSFLILTIEKAKKLLLFLVPIIVSIYLSNGASKQNEIIIMQNQTIIEQNEEKEKCAEEQRELEKRQVEALEHICNFLQIFGDDSIDYIGLFDAVHDGVNISDDDINISDNSADTVEIDEHQNCDEDD